MDKESVKIMYTEITIINFRGLKNLQIGDLQKINLFVGKNNSGKTSILESLFLITGSTNSQLPITINIFRGLGDVGGNSWSWIFNGLDLKRSIKISSSLKNKEKRELEIFPEIKNETRDELTKKTISKEDIQNVGSHSELAASVDGLILETTFFEKKKKKKKITSNIKEMDWGLSLNIPKSYIEDLRGVYIDAKILSVEISQRFSNIQIKKRVSSIVKILKQIEPTLKIWFWEPMALFMEI